MTDAHRTPETDPHCRSRRTRPGQRGVGARRADHSPCAQGVHPNSAIADAATLTVGTLLRDDCGTLYLTPTTRARLVIGGG